MQLTLLDITTTLDQAGLWGVSFRALAAELSRRFPVSEEDARTAIEHFVRQGELVLNSIGEVGRADPRGDLGPYPSCPAIR
jgi:hypothetical protein